MPASVVAMFLVGHAPRGSKCLLAEITSCVVFASSSRFHVCELEAPNVYLQTLLTDCLSTTLDELRWVGINSCDLPVLSVFKDLHPRVTGFVFLTISRSDQTDAHNASLASDSPRSSPAFSTEDIDPGFHQNRQKRSRLL